MRANNSEISGGEDHDDRDDSSDGSGGVSVPPVSEERVRMRGTVMRITFTSGRVRAAVRGQIIALYLPSSSSSSSRHCSAMAATTHVDVDVDVDVCVGGGPIDTPHY